MKNLAQTILQLRQLQGLTQRAIGEKLQITQRCYASWEQGRTEPSVEMLVKLADIFECTVDYMLGRSDDIGSIKVESNLDEFEKSLLAIIKRLSTNDKFQVMGFAKSLAN